jgi:hypothetical protein
MVVRSLASIRTVPPVTELDASPTIRPLTSSATARLSAPSSSVPPLLTPEASWTASSPVASSVRTVLTGNGDRHLDFYLSECGKSYGSINYILQNPSSSHRLKEICPEGISQ